MTLPVIVTCTSRRILLFICIFFPRVPSGRTLWLSAMALRATLFCHELFLKTLIFQTEFQLKFNVALAVSCGRSPELKKDGQFTGFFKGSFFLLLLLGWLLPAAHRIMTFVLLVLGLVFQHLAGTPNAAPLKLGECVCVIMYMCEILLGRYVKHAEHSPIPGVSSS